MKIAIEAQRIFRKKKHGMDIAILEIIRCLQQIDKENEYYILVKPDSDDQVLTETDNFHIVRIPVAPYPVWEQILLPLKIRQIKPDVLHCTSDTAPVFVNTPLVITLHDILYMKNSELFKQGTWYQRLGNLYRKWIVPEIVKNAEQIITVSNFEKSEITSYFPNTEEKIRVIPNAHSSSFQVIEDVDKLRLFKSSHQLPDRFILYHGNTHPNKNLENVLRAIKILVDQESMDFHLVVTDLSLKSLNETLDRIGCPEVGRFIHLTGYIPNRELVYLYNLAALFIYPSFYESFGIPILEAMASGTPVIASKTAAIPETAGDEAAVFFNPGEPKEIARVMKQSMSNEALHAQNVEKGLQWAQNFNWNHAAHQNIALYREIYEKQNPRLIANPTI